MHGLFFPLRFAQAKKNAVTQTYMLAIHYDAMVLMRQLGVQALQAHVRLDCIYRASVFHSCKRVNSNTHHIVLESLNDQKHTVKACKHPHTLAYGRRPRLTNVAPLRVDALSE